MKLKALLAFAILVSTVSSSFGYNLNPAIRASGQALTMSCDPKTDSACLSACNNPSYCEFKEPFCRNCAGTQNLKLKRIFDSVGTSIIAVGEKKSDDQLIQILKSGSFASLHSMTIYNYSGAYDGEQARGMFRYLCPNLSIISEKMGILLISLDKNNATTGVLGAICPDDKTNQASFYPTNSRWQMP